MYVGLVLLLAFATVPLGGGRFSALAELRLRLVWLAVAALAVQVLVVNVIPDAGIPHEAIHVATFAVLGAVVLANARVPGVPVVALGGLCNAIAIVANGGVMPASEAALATAGLPADPGVYTNSGLVENARMAFLGDVFALPSWMPMANVFSVGDVLLAAGGALMIHAAAGSRLVPRAWRAVAAQ